MASVKKLVNNQRTIETEASLLVAELRREIAKLSKLMYSMNDEDFNVYLQKTLTKLRALLDVNDIKIEKAAIDLAAELASVTRKEAIAAYAKMKPPGITKNGIAAATIRTIRNEMQRLKGQKNSIQDITKQIVGTRTEQYLDGLLAPTIHATDTNARTLAKAAEETAADKKRRQNVDIIGYHWISVLDSATCIAKDQFVNMSDGTCKKIQDVIEGDYIISHLGKARKVLSSEKTGYKKVIKVTFSDGRQLTATPDHLIWVAGEWVRLDSIPHV